MLFKKIQEKKQAEMRRQKKDVAKKVGAALLIGSVVSAVVTLFTAPKSGKEMRKDVADKAIEGAEIVKEGATKVAKKTSEVVNEAIDKGQTIKEKVIDKVNAKKSEIKKETAEIKEDLGVIKDTVSEGVEDIVENVEEKLES